MAAFRPPPLNSLDPGQESGFVPPPLSSLDESSSASSELYMPNVMSPEEERAAVEQFGKEHPAVENLAGAIMRTAKGVPGFVAHLPQYAYRGYQLAAGSPEQRAQAIMGLGAEALPQGQEMARQLQSPIGSEDWFQGLIQAGMMATPGLELARELRPPLEIKPPPVQPEAFQLPPSPATLGPTSIGADVRRAMQGQADRSLEETLAQAQVPSNINIETGQAFFPERGTQIGLPSETAQIAGLIKEKQNLEAKTAPSRAIGQQVHPTVENRIAQINQELGQPEAPPPVTPPVEIPAADRPYAGVAEPTKSVTTPESGQAAGTSNRLFQELHGEGAVPSGTGVDTGKLLDNARGALSSGAVDPYSVLSKTRQKGVANVEEYATLAAEHERLVNDAVAKQKANDPTAAEAAARANDFANAIQPHKTAASDLFRLMQGDINYDMGTPFGIEQYMKAELGRGMKASEVPKFKKMASDIRQAESQVPDAVARADAKVQRSYAKIADISMEEAVARVKRQLADCV